MNEFRTRKRLAVLLGTLALGASLAAGSALAGRGDRAFGGPPLRRALAMLDLTQDQRDAIHKRMEDHRPAFQSLREKLRSSRLALRDAANQPNADPAAVGAAFLRLKANREAIRAERQKAKAEIESLLTERQKAKLEGFRAARPGPFRRFHGGPAGDVSEN